MENVLKLDRVEQYNDLVHYPTLHPLVSVIDFSEVRPIRSSLRSFGVYAIFLKDVKCGDMIYGRQTYDYQEGTLVCLAPGQVFGAKDDGQLRQPKGWALLFHPDLLRGTQLGRNIRNYTFFFPTRCAKRSTSRSRSGARSSTACTTSATSCSTPSTATAARSS